MCLYDGSTTLTTIPYTVKLFTA